MKYTKDTPPIVCMQTNSSCYKKTKNEGSWIAIKGRPNYMGSIYQGMDV